MKTIPQKHTHNLNTNIRTYTDLAACNDYADTVDDLSSRWLHAITMHVDGSHITFSNVQIELMVSLII